LAINLDHLVLPIVVSIIVTSPSLWIVGRILVGKNKAKLSDAVWIVAVGTIIGAIISGFFHGGLAEFVQFLLWLYLIRIRYETNWLKAFIVSILAVVVNMAIRIIILGIGML